MQKTFKISFVGLDEKVFLILCHSDHFDIVCVNLIPEFLTEKTLNPVDYIFKIIYFLRYKNHYRMIENLFRGLYYSCFYLSSQLYRRLLLFYFQLSRNKITVLTSENERKFPISAPTY